MDPILRQSLRLMVGGVLLILTGYVLRRRYPDPHGD